MTTNDFREGRLPLAVMLETRPVVIWRLNRWYFTDKVKSQRELNELTTPPPFLLSERYGQFIAQVVYSLIFSAAIPIVHVAMVVFIAMSIVIDRVMLVRYCANPPRYSAKLAALLIHSMPVAVALHFAVAVWAFGARDAPSASGAPAALRARLPRSSLVARAGTAFAATPNPMVGCA